MRSLALHQEVSDWYFSYGTTTKSVLENGMSEALTLALYILVCKEIGQVPLFPGNKFFYHCADDNSYAPSLAEMSIWATTHDHTRNEAFNHVNGDVFVWRYFLPKIGAYFGVEVRTTLPNTLQILTIHRYQTRHNSRS
jgi:hypothetical protein